MFERRDSSCDSVASANSRETKVHPSIIIKGRIYYRCFSKLQRNRSSEDAEYDFQMVCTYFSYRMIHYAG